VNCPTSPSISICYATRNRSSQLQTSIQSIIDNCNTLSAIELIIIDSSDDQHSNANIAYSQTIQTSFAHLYYQNTQPEGTDNAYIQAVKAARAPYVWLLSDDDLISCSIDSCISDIYNITSTKSKYCFLVNMSLATADLSRILAHSICDVSGLKQSRSGSLEDLLRYTSFLSSHISFIIFDRQSWLKVLQFFPHIPHLTVPGISMYLSIVHTNVIIEKPLLTLRSGCQSWVKDSYSIWYLYWPSLLLYLGLKPSSVLSLPSYRLTCFARNLILYRSFAEHFENKPILYKRLSVLHWLLLFVAMRIPQNLCYRISIAVSSFARFPEVTLRQLIDFKG
jgi:glycosyltransferase involved in cell wall biosynthesis